MEPEILYLSISAGTCSLFNLYIIARMKAINDADNGRDTSFSRAIISSYNNYARKHHKKQITNEKEFQEFLTENRQSKLESSLQKAGEQ